MDHSTNGASSELSDLLHYLAVPFGVVKLPAATRYGVWKGEKNRHRQDEAISVGPRSPRLEPRLERDRVGRQLRLVVLGLLLRPVDIVRLVVDDVVGVPARIPGMVRLGGRIDLDRDAAREAVATIAEERGTSVEAAAQAILDVVNETVHGARACRRPSVATARVTSSRSRSAAPGRYTRTRWRT